jgi:glycosyltransferase involved in cell wall biosynthesis
MEDENKIKVLFLLNQLRAGTGPFQRAIRLDDEVFDITVLSCYDTLGEANKTARLLRDDFGARSIVGFGEKNKIRLFFKLVKYLRKYRPDIIQTAHTYTSIVAILISRFFNLGVVVNFEGTLYCRKGRVKSFLTMLALSPAHGAVCVSNAVFKANAFSEDLLRQHMDRRIIYNGVDFNDIDRKQDVFFDWEHTLDENNFVVGFVGDLKSVKDVPTLIRGFSLLVKESDNVCLLIVGDGELKDELIQIAQESCILNKIIFTGHIQRHEVYHTLKLMDVFVMPSYVEGLSEAIAQAMASSLPVIASDIAPNRELIKHGKNGFLFKNGDSVVLSKHLLELKEDIELRRDFASRNRKIAEQRLDIYKIIIQYKEFYLWLLKNNGICE